MKLLGEKTKAIYLGTALAIGSVANIALAQITFNSSGSPTLDNLVQKIIGTLNKVIYVIFALATVAFGWGVIEMLAGSGDSEKIKKGKQHLIWGIVGMAIMASAWGIVGIIKDYLDLGSVYY